MPGPGSIAQLRARSPRGTASAPTWVRPVAVPYVLWACALWTLGLAHPARGECPQPFPAVTDVFRGGWAMDTPRPTSAWWENLAVGGRHRGPRGNAYPLPYIVWPDTSGLRIAVPFLLSNADGSVESAFDDVVRNVWLGAAEQLNGHAVERSDALTVTLQWVRARQGRASTTSTDIEGHPGGPQAEPQPVLRVPLARGSPFVTALFNGSTPLVKSAQAADAGVGYSVDGERVDCPGVHVGRVFRAVARESEEEWTVYAAPAIALRCARDGDPLELRADGPWTGMLRLALTGNCSLGQKRPQCADAGPPGSFRGVLDSAAWVYPTASDVDLFRPRQDLVSVRVTWHVERVAAPSNTSHSFVQGLLPHHLESARCEDEDEGMESVRISPGRLVGPGPYSRTLFGVMNLARLAFGSDDFRAEWIQTIAAPPVPWLALRPLASSAAHSAVDAVLADDAQDALDALASGAFGGASVADGGSMAASAARLALIARDLGATAVADNLTASLVDAVSDWFAGERGDPLVYDESWGALVPCGCRLSPSCGPDCLESCRLGGPAGCPSLDDGGAEAFQSHLRTFGGWLVALAVLARDNPLWRAANACKIRAIAGDILEPSGPGHAYPAMRHKVRASRPCLDVGALSQRLRRSGRTGILASRGRWFPRKGTAVDWSGSGEACRATLPVSCLVRGQSPFMRWPLADGAVPLSPSCSDGHGLGGHGDGRPRRTDHRAGLVHVRAPGRGAERSLRRRTRSIWHHLRQTQDGADLRRRGSIRRAIAAARSRPGVE